MQTLVIKVNGITRNYLLNTKIKVETTEKIINEILDTHQPEDWYIKEGFILNKPLYIKHLI